MAARACGKVVRAHGGGREGAGARTEHVPDEFNVEHNFVDRTPVTRAGLGTHAVLVVAVGVFGLVVVLAVVIHVRTRKFSYFRYVSSLTFVLRVAL